MNARAAEKSYSKNIRRLLRRKHSGEYFTGAGWTKDVEKACVFQDSLEAARMCSAHALDDVELVLRMADGKVDLFCSDLR